MSVLLSPLTVRTRGDDAGAVADLVRADGTVLWPDYAHGPDELLAILTAEQRYLVEEQGGSVSGETYVEKAQERLRRAAKEES